MRRVFVSPAALAPGAPTLSLVGDAHQHLARVLRLRVGDAVTLFDGEGHEVDATILATSARATEVALGARRDVAGAPVSITLLQGLPRGEKMEWIVQKTTELGVARIVPVLCARAVPRPDQRASQTKQQRWQTIAVEAARQCGRADVPQIDAPASLADALAFATGVRFVVWENTRGQPLRRFLASPPGAVTLLVGPEGGLTEAEVASARVVGFQEAGLGPRILRAETAAVVAVALVQAAGGGLD